MNGKGRSPARSRASDPPPSRRDHATIFLVSAALLVYQIALTRVLSVVVWYHFAFLVISLVMLGLGAPGVWFTFSRRPLRFLPALLLAGGLLVPASIVLLVKHGAALGSVSIVFVALGVVPAMLALGGAVCLLLIRAHGSAVAAMYGWDLLGAGAGAVLVIPLLYGIDTPRLAAACGLLPLLALVLRGGRWGGWGLAAATALALCLVVPGAFTLTRSKSYDETAIQPIHESWSPIARLTVFDESFSYLQGHEGGFAWGRGSRYPHGGRVRQYWLEQDGSAGTPITEFDGDLGAVSHLLYDVTTAGHQLREPDRVAVIGVGGGRDILSALLVGASEVDAVELNPDVIETVSGRFALISGDIYHRPGVRVVLGEGRSYLQHTTERYDLIQIALTDSWAASTSGAYALAENNLYTVEAFRLYRRRLTDAGALSVSRWLKEMPWLAGLARSALAADGIEEPQRHVAVVAAGRLGTLILSRRPWSEEDTQRLREIARERGFQILYPLSQGEPRLNRFLFDVLEGGLQSAGRLGLVTDPPTDDRPYFFHVVSPFRADAALHPRVLEATGLSLNLGPTVTLRQAMISVSILAGLLFLVPFGGRALRLSGGDRLSHAGRGSLYFAAIGAGFMLTENVLIQRLGLFLGHPTYAVTVVLGTLLLGMAAGATMAARFGLGRLQRWGWAAPAGLAAVMLALPALFSAGLGLPLGLRILATGAGLLLLGGVLGLFFPLGMLRFGDRLKPWFWAVNGVLGVVASVMSLALSMEFGFRVVGLVGAAAYLLAWLAVIGRARADAEGVKEAG